MGENDFIRRETEAETEEETEIETETETETETESQRLVSHSSYLHTCHRHLSHALYHACSSITRRRS